MPVEFARKKKGANQTKRVRFVRNTSEGGVDYGPDYELSEAELPAHRADYYLAQKRAVEVKTAAPVEGGQQRDPEAENRDPQVGKGSETKSALAQARARAKAGKEK